jgi:hypothetical protein
MIGTEKSPASVVKTLTGQKPTTHQVQLKGASSDENYHQ